jgi:hypothetical protein
MQESLMYQKNLQKGAKQSKLGTLIRQLSRQFRTIYPELQEQLQALSIEQLDDLSYALFDFSTISNLATWLQNQ